MITPEKASKKRRLLSSGGAPPSKESYVSLIDIQSTGIITGNDITVKSEPRDSALATIAPNIVVIEATARLPAAAIAIKYTL